MKRLVINRVAYYVALFLLLIFLNQSYLFIPLFEIDFYENSAYFIERLSMRVDLLIILAFFYVKTSLPKEFKVFLLAYSCVVICNVIALLPLEDSIIGLNLFIFIAFIFFSCLWTVSILAEKILNTYFVTSVYNKLNEHKKTAYLEVIGELEIMLQDGILTPQEFIKAVNEIKDELK